MKPRHSEATLVSANVLSDSTILPINLHSDVQFAYLPEPIPLSRTTYPRSRWASKLPSWPGDAASNAAVTYVHNSSGIPGAEKYRWLPLRGRRHISASQAQQLFDEDGHVEGWRRAVQADYIFLENLELNRLEKYLLRTPSRQSSGLLAVWDLAVRDYSSLSRWRKNKDVEKRDTGILSIPTDSKAIAAKMDSTWEAEFDRTDLMERYHRYAR